MNLVLDLGNTRLKAGLFEANLLKEKAIWQDWTLETLTAFLKNKNVESAILSSVAEPKPEMTDFLKKKFQFIELGASTKIPFRNQYKTPETLGKDRIAAMAAARQLFPRQNVLVIDCGTCIKYDFMDVHGIYKGGNIAPGAAMRIKAMHHFTARLPEVEFRLPANPVGETTETALQNGALRGAAFEIEGAVRFFKEKLGNMRVVLSGGDADFFSKILKIKSLYLEPDLIMKGLNFILKHNR